MLSTRRLADAVRLPTHVESYLRKSVLCSLTKKSNGVSREYVHCEQGACISHQRGTETDSTLVKVGGTKTGKLLALSRLILLVVRSLK